MLSYKEFAKKQINVADCVNNGQCGGTYADAVIILCSAISAMAAMRWPGKKIDNNRFVQILIEADAQTWKKISIPLLAQSGEKMLEWLHVPDLPRVPQSSDDVFDGNDGLKLAGKPTRKSCKAIRRHSYACLLYTEIRCGYSHEMLPGGNSSGSPALYGDMSSISYQNCCGKRKIHFPILLIADAVQKIATNLDLKCKEHNVRFTEAFRDDPPNPWWLEGCPGSC